MCKKVLPKKEKFMKKRGFMPVWSNLWWYAKTFLRVKEAIP